MDNDSNTVCMKSPRDEQMSDKNKIDIIHFDQEQNNYSCKTQSEGEENDIVVDCVHLKAEEFDDEGNEENVCLDVKRNINVDDGTDVIRKMFIPHEGVSPISWPQNVELYQPLESKQMLYSEMPDCLYAQAFLRMCNLKYILVQKTNSEKIGPSEEVPVLRCGRFIVSGADKIIQFLESRGISLPNSLSESEKSEMSAYVSLVKMTIAYAEDYVTWLDSEIYTNVTRGRFCSIHPWPLSSYLIKKKQQRVQNKLDAMGWGGKSFEEVCEEVDLCFRSLSDKLQRNLFFFNNQPTCLDALVFAHAYTIMTTSLPKSQFAGIILGYPKIVKHCHRFMDRFFSEFNTSNQFAELVNNLSL